MTSQTPSHRHDHAVFSATKIPGTGRRVRTWCALTLLLAALAGAGCGNRGSDDTDLADQGCSPGQLRTLSPNKLTVATAQPAVAPWFTAGEPTSRKGFESAVTYAVADELGYANGEVWWSTVDRETVLSGQPASFDVAVNQFRSDEVDESARDVSSGYYSVKQAVVTRRESGYTQATSLEQLRGATIGVRENSVSAETVEDIVKPDTAARTFGTDDDARNALAAQQIDAVVIDLPQAFRLVSDGATDAGIVGQLSPSNGSDGQFGLVLQHESPLTRCVNLALSKLRNNGVLDALEDEWLADATGTPVLGE